MEDKKKMHAKHIVLRIFKRFEEYYLTPSKKYPVERWWVLPFKECVGFEQSEWLKTLNLWIRWAYFTIKTEQDLLTIKQVLDDLSLKLIRNCRYYPPRLDHFADLFKTYKKNNF